LLYIVFSECLFFPEKEIAMYGRVLSSENADGDGIENEGINNDGEEMETTDASLSGGHLI
jgi:hypothetical protein